MKKIEVDERRCPQNHPCPSIGVCSVGALRQTGFKAPVVDGRLCTGCGKCARFCPRGALRLRDV